MLTYKGKRIEQLAIWFVDGLAVSANIDPCALLIQKQHSGRLDVVSWFDILIYIQDNEPARIWKADFRLGANFEDSYISRMVADFWCNNTTDKPYWKSWWIETTAGDRYNHEFTAHHQSDAAAHFNRRHPGVQISSVMGKDRVYLNANVRQMVDTDPFSANQPISSLLQFENVS